MEVMMKMTMTMEKMKKLRKNRTFVRRKVTK
jgi:hypothetical protein